MLQFNRIDHLGMAVPDLTPQLALLEGLFGFRRQREWEDRELGYRAVMLQMPGNHGVGWEVRAPTGDSSSLRPFLDSPRGPGMHHVAIEVPDVQATAQELSRLGIEPHLEPSGNAVDIRPSQGGHGFLFHFFGPGGGVKGQQASSTKEDPAGSIGITRIDHVCHAYRDRDELRRWYEQVFGMRQIYRTPDGEHPDLADLVLEIPGKQMLWEIIQPVGDESFIQRFLDTRGPCIHHVTFEVGDWQRAMAACQEHQVRLLDEQSGETDGAHWRDTFIHPRSTGGVLVQLYWEEKPGVWIKSDKIPT